MSQKWGPKQRLQMRDLYQQMLNMPRECPGCGGRMRTTSGSNAQHMRIKCQHCGRILLQEPTRWD